MNVDALFSGVGAFVGAGIYFFLGLRLSRRPVSPAARLAAGQFALFWVGLAGVTLIGGAESLVAAFMPPPFALVATLLYLELLVLCVVLWALIGYLTFLFLGRSLLVPLSAFYGLSYVLLLYYIVASGPDGVVVTTGAVSTSFATPVGGVLLAAVFAVLILPEFVASALYFALFFRTTDRTVRYRIAIVSWSLILWFGLSSVNLGSLLGGSLAAAVFGRSLGVLAAIAILLAYYPPRALRERFGVRGIEETAMSVP